MKKDVVDAVVEIPFRSRNKFEVDHKSGRLRLDRVLYSAMGYPAEYGFIEDTLALDGDPLDILVIGTEPTYPGCIVPARVIGYLEAVDNGFEDYKLISVVDVDPRYDDVVNLKDLTCCNELNFFCLFLFNKFLNSIQYFNSSFVFI